MNYQELRLVDDALSSERTQGSTRSELRLVDDGVRYVEGIVTSILREYDGIEPRFLDLDTIQYELDKALPHMRPVVSIQHDRLNVTFV